MIGDRTKKSAAFLSARIAALLCTALFCLPDSRADLILGETDWNAGGLAGWTTPDSWVTLSNPGSGGIADTGFLQSDLALTAPGNEGVAEWWALMSTPATNLFAGTWNTNMWLTFDFWASNVAPGYVQVRWSGSSNRIWQFTVATNDFTTQTWASVASATLADATLWSYGPSATQQQFLDDLASIDWIGVYVWRDTNVDQVYGLDDFQLMVPEPGQYYMLGLALLTTVYSFWKKRRESAG